MDITYKRPDGTFVATLNGAPYHIIPGDPAFAQAQIDGAQASFEPLPPTALEPTIEELRAAMVVSPLQGILTLGETEWGKVLAYRETASWAEKVVIDSAQDWQRNSQNIAFFGYLLGYTPEQMDALFIAAAQVTA
jgi:hypothetical protein